MNFPQFFLSAVIFLQLQLKDKLLVLGADECRSSTLTCYDCDSRRDPYCADPFNTTLPSELKPATKVCVGCCLKIIHKFPHEQWIQRTCTENIIINYFIVDHVCLTEGKRRGKMCFCEENLCNGANNDLLGSNSLVLAFSVAFYYLYNHLFFFPVAVPSFTMT